ncbi:hypothetical protein HID58_062565 [Brassica napus]|uniref:Uncharacterized protein n=1 Tax=Brassica napus TaxID=3708 RepID=A0ABQ8A1T0_BRANA|nr:hypothetical protein HID58_062565 [Brassica napus]
MELLHLFCRIQVKVGGKPVIVRVKRKVGRDLKTLWQLGLEINERSFKLPLLNLSKLPLSGSVKKDLNVVHVAEDSDVNENSCSKGKFEEPKVAFKKEGTALDQRLQKATANSRLVKSFTVSARPLHRMLGLSNWRSGKGNKDKELHERCSFYDVIRVDAEEKPECIFSSYSRLTSLEDQKLLASFLPVLRESICMIGAVGPWLYTLYSIVSKKPQVKKEINTKLHLVSS